MITQGVLSKGAKFNVYVAAAMFAVTPFVFYAGPGSFTLPKAVAVEIAAWLLFASLTVNKPDGVTPVRAPLLAFVLIYALTAFCAGNPLISVKAVALFSSGAALAWALAPIAAAQARPRRLCAVIIGAGTVMAAHGLFQYFGADIPVLRGVLFRVFSTAGTPATLAGYLAVCFCLALPLIACEENPGRAISLYLSLFVISLCLALSASRSGLAAVAAGAALTAALILWPPKRRPRRAAVRLLACGGVFSLSIFIMLFLYSSNALIPFQDSRPGEMQLKPSDKTAKDASVTLRLFTLKCGFAMWRERPVFGNGPGSFAYLYPMAQAKEIAKLKPDVPARLAKLISHRLATHAHNEYAEIAVESGAAGLAAFLALVALTLKSMSYGIARTRRPSERAMHCGTAGAFVALLAQSCFEFTLHDPLTAMLFWSMMGIGCAPALMRSESHVYGGRGRGLTYAGLGLAAGAVLYATTPFVAMNLAMHSAGRLGAEGREGLPALNFASRLDPASADILLLNARALRRFGELPDALDKLAAARSLSNSPEVYSELGRTQAMAGMFEDAEENFATALSIDPWMNASLQNVIQMAILMRRTGRDDEAEALIRRAADIARPAPAQREALLKYLDGMRRAAPRR